MIALPSLINNLSFSCTFVLTVLQCTYSRDSPPEVKSPASRIKWWWINLISASDGTSTDRPQSVCYTGCLMHVVLKKCQEPDEIVCFNLIDCHYATSGSQGKMYTCKLNVYKLYSLGASNTFSLRHFVASKLCRLLTSKMICSALFVVDWYFCKLGFQCWFIFVVIFLYNTIFHIPLIQIRWFLKTLSNPNKLLVAFHVACNQTDLSWLKLDWISIFLPFMFTRLGL